jgi:hypothetical protein
LTAAVPISEPLATPHVANCGDDCVSVERRHGINETNVYWVVEIYSRTGLSLRNMVSVTRSLVRVGRLKRVQVDAAYALDTILVERRHGRN